MSRAAPILVVAPLGEELGALLGRLEGGRRETLAGTQVVRGTLGGCAVAAAVIGDGRTRATRSLRALLETVRPAGLLGLGVAGGLDPALAWGEVLASGSVHGAEGEAPPPDAAWQARAASAGLLLAPFAVAPRIVATPEAKAALRERLGGEVACVDLESGVVAEEARTAGVPYVVVRAVVDEAGDEVAASILAAQDEDGHVVKAKVVVRAMLKPSEIRRLKKIQARVVVCAERLADAVEAMLASYASQAATASSGA